MFEFRRNGDDGAETAAAPYVPANEYIFQFDKSIVLIFEASSKLILREYCNRRNHKNWKTVSAAVKRVRANRTDGWIKLNEMRALESCYFFFTFSKTKELLQLVCGHATAFVRQSMSALLRTLRKFHARIRRT